MEDNFKLEIISPERIIFSDEATMVTLPSYEGDMSILKNHISIITLLRPGIIKVQKNDKNFKELIGQDIMVETLVNSIKSNRIAQAFMLTGERGTGKTSTARIISKSLTCTGNFLEGVKCKTGEICHCEEITNDKH